MHTNCVIRLFNAGNMDGETQFDLRPSSRQAGVPRVL